MNEHEVKWIMTRFLFLNELYHCECMKCVGVS